MTVLMVMVMVVVNGGLPQIFILKKADVTFFSFDFS
jgi:hypothetical protein